MDGVINAKMVLYEEILVYTRSSLFPLRYVRISKSGIKIFSRIAVRAWLIRRVLDWMIVFIDTLYTDNSELHVITALSMTYTYYNSSLHTH
jgi:hypothetical protein